MHDLINIVMNSAKAAFIEVGSFVGIVLLVFGYINFKQSGKFIAVIERSKKWQPILGALLGLTPGCGGAIFIMPLFFKGTVTFGTIISTLIATMGDSAFVIIASHPIYYIIISILSLIVAIFTGYIVDQTNLGISILNKYKAKKRSKSELLLLNERADHSIQSHNNQNRGESPFPHIGHHEGDEIDLILHHKAKGHQNLHTFGYQFTHTAYYLYWFFIGIGFIFGILFLFQLEVNSFYLSNLGFLIGVAGTLFSILMMIMGKKFLSHDTHEEAELKVMSLKETLIHNAQDTAFVITWVFIGFLVYELIVLVLGGGNYEVGENLIESLLLATGAISILIGAFVGLIPGCGPQIIFVTLFTRGLIPFAALFANAISQDGDALFPIIAIDRRSALWATIITTIPAILFGFLIYWFEIHINIQWILQTVMKITKVS